MLLSPFHSGKVNLRTAVFEQAAAVQSFNAIHAFFKRYPYSLVYLTRHSSVRVSRAQLVAPAVYNAVLHYRVLHHLNRLLWFLSLLVLIILILSVFCFIQSDNKKNQRKLPSGTRVDFSHDAHLASMSYYIRLTSPRTQSQAEVVVPHLNPTPDRLPSIEINDADDVNVSVIGQAAIVQIEYQVKGIEANNAIWLLRHVNAANPNSWVVIFRGTKSIDNIMVDLSLVASVAGDDTAKCDAFADRRAKQLTVDAFLDHGVRKEHSITLIGHSLGAAVAEAMLARFHHAGYNSVKACAFDSLRTPYDLRTKLRNTPWKNLSCVYSRDNPIKNLCPAPP